MLYRNKLLACEIYTNDLEVKKEKDDEDEISGKDLMKLIRKAQKKEKNLEKQEKLAEKMDINALTPTREGKTIKRSGSVGENSNREIDGHSQPKKIRRSSDNRHSLLTVIINLIHILFVSYVKSSLF